MLTAWVSGVHGGVSGVLRRQSLVSLCMGSRGSARCARHFGGLRARHDVGLRWDVMFHVQQLGVVSSPYVLVA